MPDLPEAWVTLATNDSYALGALVLAHSLKHVKTTRQMVVMITSDVSESMRNQLSSTFDLVETVDVMDSNDQANLELLNRPELGVTFTKLHCWRLTQYSKCVFMDADTLVLQNCDELFEREELSAAPDIGWPDCFNSGVFVYRPSQETYTSLLSFALTTGSFDGGDQGLLNMYFSDWATKDISKHLSFGYNTVAATVYSYLPAYRYFGPKVKVVHFFGVTKPWMYHYDGGTTHVGRGDEHLTDNLNSWWQIFMEKVAPALNEPTHYSGHAAHVAEVVIRKREEDEVRRARWEQGRMDYMGEDSFDSVIERLSEVMQENAPPQEPEKPKKK